MKITEYADIANINIKLTYYHNQNTRWCAIFEMADVKEQAVLISAHGNGNTPQAALEDYLDKIRGKTIVFNAADKLNRRELIVPKSLEV